MKKNKKIEAICKNCRLFDSANNLCRVIVLHEGEKVCLPVSPEDPCFFEQEYYDPITNEKQNFNEVKQVRFWVEDKNGKKTNKNGTVKMEYPEGFFGDLTINDIV